MSPIRPYRCHATVCDDWLRKSWCGKKKNDGCCATGSEPREASAKVAERARRGGDIMGRADGNMGAGLWLDEIGDEDARWLRNRNGMRTDGMAAGAINRSGSRHGQTPCGARRRSAVVARGTTRVLRRDGAERG